MRAAGLMVSERTHLGRSGRLVRPAARGRTSGRWKSCRLRRRWAAGLREVRIRVARREFFCGTIVDEFLVEKALHGPALSPDITQGMPRRDQFGVARRAGS